MEMRDSNKHGRDQERMGINLWNTEQQAGQAHCVRINRLASLTARRCRNPIFFPRGLREDKVVKIRPCDIWCFSKRKQVRDVALQLIRVMSPTCISDNTPLQKMRPAHAAGFLVLLYYWVEDTSKSTLLPNAKLRSEFNTDSRKCDTCWSKKTI